MFVHTLFRNGLYNGIVDGISTPSAMEYSGNGAFFSRFPQKNRSAAMAMRQICLFLADICRNLAVFLEFFRDVYYNGTYRRKQPPADVISALCGNRRLSPVQRQTKRAADIKNRALPSQTL